MMPLHNCCTATTGASKMVFKPCTMSLPPMAQAEAAFKFKWMSAYDDCRGSVRAACTVLSGNRCSIGEVGAAAGAAATAGRRQAQRELMRGANLPRWV